MNQTTPHGIVMIGTGLGLLGDWWLRGQPVGCGVFLWGVALVVAVMWVTGRLSRQGLLQPGTWMLFGGMASLSLWAWRDTEPLLVWGTLGFLAALVLAGIETVQHPLSQLRVLRALGRALALVAGVVFQPLRFCPGGDAAAPGHGGTIRSGRVGAWAVGVLLSAAVLVVFGALLRAGDPLFAKFTDPLLQWRWKTLVSHLLVILVLGWLATGYLGIARFGLPAWVQRQEPWLPPFPRVETAAWALPLLTLNLLLVLHACVQARFWFGGRETVLATAGLTLAQYARRGFFELVVTAGLVLGALWLADSVRHPGVTHELRVYRRLALPLMLLVTVLMVSAALRLGLYMEHFGLTESRLYAAAVLVWIAAVLGWFAVTVLRDRAQRFLFGAIVLAYVTFLALAALNPHGWVARVNLARAARGHALDLQHLARLSADAVPAIVAAWEKLSPGDREWLSGHLLERGRRPRGDWRSWNLARHRANAAVAALSPAKP